MPACLLLELPREIIELVFDLVSSFRDRLSASLTCKKLQHLIQPILYRDIRFRKHVSPKTQLQIFLLKRRIPQCVRYLSLPPWGKYEDCEIDDEDINVIREIDPGGEFFGLKILDTRRQKIRSITGATLALCPNLRELDCRGISSDYASFWLQGFAAAARGMPWPNSFSNLVRVNIEDYDSTNGSAKILIYTCIQMPSLREFRARKFTCWTLYDEDYDYELREGMTSNGFEIGCSRVESLEFRMATMPARAINEVILMTERSLENFCLEFSMRRAAPVYLHLGHLINSLTRVASTLQRLEITWIAPHQHSHTMGSLGFLGNLVNLKHLICDKVFLVDRINQWIRRSRTVSDHIYVGGIPPFANSAVDILPLKLESLDLVYCSRHVRQPLDSRLEEYIGDLATARASRCLPHLSFVTVQGATIDWVPKHFNQTDVSPPSLENRRSNTSGWLVEAWTNGQSFQLGSRPHDKTWVSREHKKRWKKLWAKTRDAGVRLSPASTDFLPEYESVVETVIDDDPFGLIDEA